MRRLPWTWLIHEFPNGINTGFLHLILHCSSVQSRTEHLQHTNTCNTLANDAYSMVLEKMLPWSGKNVLSQLCTNDKVQEMVLDYIPLASFLEGKGRRGKVFDHFGSYLYAYPQMGVNKIQNYLSSSPRFFLPVLYLVLDPKTINLGIPSPKLRIDTGRNERQRGRFRRRFQYPPVKRSPKLTNYSIHRATTPLTSNFISHIPHWLYEYTHIHTQQTPNHITCV